MTEEKKKIYSVLVFPLAIVLFLAGSVTGVFAWLNSFNAVKSNELPVGVISGDDVSMNVYWGDEKIDMYFFNNLLPGMEITFELVAKSMAYNRARIFLEGVSGEFEYTDNNGNVRTANTEDVFALKNPEDGSLTYIAELKDSEYKVYDEPVTFSPDGKIRFSFILVFCEDSLDPRVDINVYQGKVLYIAKIMLESYPG